MRLLSWNAGAASENRFDKSVAARFAANGESVCWIDSSDIEAATEGGDRSSSSGREPLLRSHRFLHRTFVSSTSRLDGSGSPWVAVVVPIVTGLFTSSKAVDGDTDDGSINPSGALGARGAGDRASLGVVALSTVLVTVAFSN